MVENRGLRNLMFFTLQKYVHIKKLPYQNQIGVCITNLYSEFRNDISIVKKFFYYIYWKDF